MGPRRAAAYLEDISSPGTAADALNGMRATEAGAIFEPLSNARAAALLEALDEVQAGRILAQLSHERQAAIVAGFRDPRATGLILDAMPQQTVVRLAASLEERFLARALAVMDRDHALTALDAMAMVRRKLVIGHLPSTGDARALRDLAEARLQDAENLISAAEVRAQVDAARRRRQSDLMPWTVAVASSACLLVATTIAFDVGAAALNWESWPWLFLFIPATLASVIGAGMAGSARFTTVPKPALAAALFLAASVAAVLLVTHVLPGLAGVPVVVITLLLGFALVSDQLAEESAHRRLARQAEQRAKRARLGDHGGS
jgi:hypothetical protein